VTGRVLDAGRLRGRLQTAFPGIAADAARVVRAPGRVNLIGEHVDYNDGFVLPAAIGLETWIALVPDDRGRVEMVLDADGERAAFDVTAPGPPRGTWIDYVAGLAVELGRRGVPVRGFRGVLASTIPIGSGLSSSAALELSAAWALCGGERPPLSTMELARAAQRAENGYVGVRCGIMDQFASSHGEPKAALLLDCRSLEHRRVPLPLDGHRLVVCDTQSPHRLEASEYNARRAQCEAAVAVLAERDPSIRALRDVDLATLRSAADRLDAEALRRCEHVVREIGRVEAAAEALEAGSWARVGKMFAASHASLRDLYEVSSPELDALVEIATGTPGVVASRMTGAGFGGCTVSIVQADAVDDLRRAVAAEYPRRTGLEAAVHVVEPVAGAGPVDA
jgi:galactokinase